LRISIIVPVFNGAAFVTQAVESALEQPETAEVLLVDDGSTDESLNLCRRLAGRHPRVRLLRHPGGYNRGVAASRNLGIESARFEHIAFLDADDFYLSGRFRVARDIMTADSSVDGVYDAIGTLYEDEQVGGWYREQQHPDLITIREPVAPEQLFEVLLTGGEGYFITDGVVVKAALLRKAGGFDESLRIGEDTAMWVKLSVLGRLVGGCLDEPVGRRRLHARNTIFKLRDQNPYYTVQMTRSLLAWGREQGLPRTRMVLLMDWLLNFESPEIAVESGYLRRKVRELAYLLSFPARHPLALRSSHYWSRLGVSFGLKRGRTLLRATHAGTTTVSARK
jgi:glycosyltransferase involved in cell wall biosynthesis